MTGNLAEKAAPMNLEGRYDLFSKGSSDVFSKAYDFVQADFARQMNIYPCYLTIDRNEGPICIIHNK